jgi:hypothetical protein
MVDWRIEELQYKAAIFEKITDGDVVKSRMTVPEDWKNDLNQALEGLEVVHPSRLDWHPGSDGKV